MYSNHFSGVSAETMAPGHHIARPGRAKGPVTLLALAKLFLIAGTLGAIGYFMPMWLSKLVELGSAEYWYSLRLLALGGSAGVVTLLLLVLKLWANLVKDLGRVKR